MTSDGLQIFTTSERKAFKRCPQRWWWAYRDGLSANQVSDKLWFGIGIHLALAHYYGKTGYQRQMDYIEVWEQFCDEDPMSLAVRSRPFDDAESQWVDARALGIAMLRGYHAHWGGDPDWDMVAVEHPFSILIPDPRLPGEDLAIFSSTFDGLRRSKETKQFIVPEHKTAAGIDATYIGMDDQGGAYWAVAEIILRNMGVLSKGEHIQGVEYNFLRKALPDERPKDADGYATNKPTKEHYLSALEAVPSVTIPAKATVKDLEFLALESGTTVLGERSKTQPATLFERAMAIRTQRERATQIRRMQSELLAMQATVQNGPDGLYKNPTKDCSWDCPFYLMCELHDAGGADWETFRDGTFTRVDPYDRYRKSASE